jgi:hypothetical protein
VGAIVAMAITCACIAPAADALPIVLFEPGINSGELKGGSSAGKSKFFGIRNLEAAGYGVALTIGSNGASLGTTGVIINNTEEAGTTKKCGTTIPESGEVSFSPEWHLVLASAGGGPELFLTLFLVSEFSVKCQGGATIKIKGSFLMDSVPFGKLVLAGGSGTFEMGSTCLGPGNKTPDYKKYLDANGNVKEAKLESSIGLGFEQSCMETFFDLKPTQSMEVMEP